MQYWYNRYIKTGLPTWQTITARSSFVDKLLEKTAQYKQFFNAELLHECESSTDMAQKVEAMANVIDTMPETYGQDGMGDNAIAYLHYQIRHPRYQDADWYVTEKDVIKDDQIQAFGLVQLGSNRPELGYINLVELCGMDLVTMDLDFTPAALSDIRKILANK